MVVCAVLCSFRIHNIAAAEAFTDEEGRYSDCKDDIYSWTISSYVKEGIYIIQEFNFNRSLMC